MMENRHTMKDANPLAAWPQFMEAVRLRMEKARQAYGDASFSRPLAELAGEVEEELLDVCGWAFILWCRIAAIRSGCPNGAYKACKTHQSSRAMILRQGRVIGAPRTS